LVFGEGPTPDSVQAVCKNGLGNVTVKPWRSGK
jgi:hypothetical protein